MVTPRITTGGRGHRQVAKGAVAGGGGTGLITTGSGAGGSTTTTTGTAGPGPTATTGTATTTTTSVSNLTTTAQPSTFNQTFLSSSADLTLEGRFDPVPGPTQVIPRLAYTINYNFVWDPATQTWVPDEGNSSGGVQGGAGAFLLNSQTISSGFATTRVELDEELFDTIGAFDGAAHEFEAPADGLYHVECSVDYAVSGVSGPQCIMRTAGDIEAVARIDNIDTTHPEVSKTVQLSAGDTMHLRTVHDDGSGRDLSTDRSACYMTFIQL